MCFLLSVSCLAQKWDTKEYIEKYNYQEVIGDFKNDKENKVPDSYAMYPDGTKGIYKLIVEKTKIPNKVFKLKIGGTVILKYIVDKEGYVTDIEVIQSVHKLLDNAAIKVMKSMERWIPGKVNGENIRVIYRQPFVFNL